MFKRKIATLITCSSLAVTLFGPLSVKASESEINEHIVDPKTMVVKTDKAMTKEEVDQILKSLNEKTKNSLSKSLANNKDESVEEKSKKGKEFIERYNKIYNSKDRGITIQGTHDDNTAKLRQGNFIETILDLNEGMNDLQISEVVLNGNIAKSAAKQQYPNDSQLEDAFRHYSWNFISTKDSIVGKIKTRTATINHEWGLRLVNPALSVFNEGYEKYVKQGKPSDTASNAAMNDVIQWAPGFKENCITAAKSSYSFFKGFFSVANIMDLSNNVWGRSGPTDYPGASYTSAFLQDKGKNNLILNEAYVGDYQYNMVWQNQWYTY
ncbi:hypothetical protein ACI48J_03750 [Paenibacillus chitinolyticus]|uniref:hypothetical protein n=1 Tax=Paenibacillus chitinolyticus TaxID=79263 RepID=UPI00386C5800